MTLGPLVLNVANRDPGTLAVMAATLQHVSEGRLFMGLGAGARVGSTFATEQEALGRPVLSAAERRRSLERTVDVLHRVWSGAVPPATGFLKPHPIPPIVIAATGPKTAELAGRKGDGICFPVGPSMRELLDVARQAAAESGRQPDDLLVTATLSSWPDRSAQPPVWPELDRLVVSVEPPLKVAVARLSEMVRRS
jgi:alkanesulfonate monooxygenase SsuD/methylene tetrahydromethanopterin reductase-like flavin-dependent oxidoreductase (luciferase family)